MHRISPFLREHPCPRPGDGVHQWLFRAALSLRGSGMTDEAEIARILEERASRRNPREIADAVRNSASVAGVASYHSIKSAPGQRSVLPNADVDTKAIEAVTKERCGLALLERRSPVQVSQWSTADFLDTLFKGDPLLCMGQSKSIFFTRRREWFRGKEHAFPLITPSPMSKLRGLTREGSTSEHCLDNTGPRHFLVIEFDEKVPDLDHQASMMLHLAKIGPLVMVLFSGGKSLHGWFSCQGADEELLHRFHRYACRLGADNRTWTRSQFVRTPGARRDNGVIQRVLFLDPLACPSSPSPDKRCPESWGMRDATALLNSDGSFPSQNEGRRFA